MALTIVVQIVANEGSTPNVEDPYLDTDFGQKWNSIKAGLIDSDRGSDPIISSAISKIDLSLENVRNIGKALANLPSFLQGLKMHRPERRCKRSVT